MAPILPGKGGHCISLVFFCFVVVTSALAHDNELENAHGHGAMNEIMADEPIIRNATEYPNTYFAHTECVGTIYAHIALMLIAWVFILPVAVVLSIARSRFTLAVQFIFLTFNAIGVVLALIYNANTPDLYPNNAHHKIGWIITWVVSAHVLVNLAGRIVNAWGGKSMNTCYKELPPSLPMSGQGSTPFVRNSNPNEEYRTSDDSGHGTASASSSIRNSSISTICADEGGTGEGHTKEYDHVGDDFENLPLSRGDSPRTTFVARIAQIGSYDIWRYFELGYKAVDRIILPFGFIVLATGITTFARLFEGNAIFGGLAHWIKGGVFFWLGLFNLGRWSGSFAELGWAWNLRPKAYNSQRLSFRPSAEFVESALILFYGSTNIFLEHLSGWGSEWSAQDLEHMAITVLFIGGGLCGILIESTCIRELLNTTTTAIPTNSYSYEEQELFQAPDSYEFSLNPMPALVILLLGIMMSSHHQATMTASMVHKQWGTLLLWASVARGFTYVLFYIKPPKSILPSRPPTELLSSFGLIAGGIIFMASSADTVSGMIHYGLDAMFLYTVTMGLVGMLMAWEVIVLAIKGWAVRQELTRNVYAS
ncbi:hypothetical protein PWT90_00112 [Aphanocladium album]|nr:hypothetical protein PWT90_00112 [Aphanocladium album]